MRLIYRAMALLMALLLLGTSAMAEIPFLQHASGWTLEGTPLEVTLSAEVLSCMPYDDDRLAMLKQVTDRLSMRLRTGTEEGSVTIFVGKSEALTLAYLDNGVQLSCIPELAFTTAEADPMGKLLGGSTTVEEPFGITLQGETLLDDGWVMLNALPTALEGYGSTKNVKTSIENMGLARTCTDYTVPAGDAEKLTEMLLALCPDGWLKEIISGLTFSGKQTLRLYRTEEGVPLRMEYNGACGPEGNLRTVKLIWRMRRDDTAHRDEVTLTSPAKSGGNKDNLTFERVISRNKKGVIEMTGSFTWTVTENRETTTLKGEFDLANACTEASDVLTGEVLLQRKLPSEDSFSGLCLKPDLTISGTEDAPQVTGSIDVSTRKGKNVLDQAIIRLSLYRGETSSWQAREEAIDLDLLTDEELAAVQNDVSMSVAAALIRPLIVLLGDSADWFFQDMLPEQVQRITDAAYTVVYE